MPEVAPDYGYSVAQKTHYFDCKFHVVCTGEGVLKIFDITQISVHEIHYIDDVKAQFDNCILIDDKGYLSRAFQHDIFDNRAIRLATYRRRNRSDFKLFHATCRKTAQAD